MLQVMILCIGKLKERYLTDACAEYTKRLSAFCKLTLTELPEARLPDSPSDAEIRKALEKEGELILSKIPRDAYVIPMCIEGKMISSPALSEKLTSVPLSGKSCIVFVIGSSCGLSDAVKARGDFKLSMSPMTFPHQLARVMLLEQIYRGFMIAAGNRYHK
ncbi:MAG: 23S rRNA (pseudouridine(1915)-N(3))-methyltransferase RlmH [Candidatus Faecivivens sp.]|nr:23S rRNA (pseudouridine(1915)-N(3))-methyltransferase RlmH [Candidatus Faecivivens sp.]